MSQMSLLSIESYKDTRKPARGRACSRVQLDLFGLVMKAVKIAKTAFKRRERYYIARTGFCARFLRYVGENSLWQTSDGLVWRATPEQVAAAMVRPLM